MALHVQIEVSSIKELELQNCIEIVQFQNDVPIHIPQSRDSRYDNPIESLRALFELGTTHARDFHLVVTSRNLKQGAIYFALFDVLVFDNHLTLRPTIDHLNGVVQFL